MFLLSRPDSDEGPSGRYGLPFYGRPASMVWAAAGNLPEQNKNNKCVNRPPGTAVKKYAGTYDLPCTVFPLKVNGITEIIS